MASLQLALRNNDFYLDGQPIRGLAGREGLLGWEILLRMRNADGTLIAPNKFIAEAERYRLTPALDRWVLTSTLEMLADQHELGSNVKLMVNVTPQSIVGDQFLEFLFAQLRETCVPGELLCFELNESAAVVQLEHTERFVRALVDAGCKVALDDFGCGLTSIAHLRKLPVDYLKIDGSLIRRIHDDRLAESIVIAVAQAAKALGIETIAEHVESEAVATRLAEIGVDYGQGFFLGRPRNIDAIIAELVASAPALHARVGG
jgi:EAL domain-containing protein (putative c-di-GMP-specific phosphodiesterase class I)